MFRASFELRMMMLSSTRVLNSPSLYLDPEGSGVDWIVDDESGIRNVCNGDLESFASAIP